MDAEKKMGPLARARMKFARDGGNEMTPGQIEDWLEGLPTLERWLFIAFGKGEDHDFADWRDDTPWRAIGAGLLMAGKIVGGLLLLIAGVLFAIHLTAK